MLDLTHSLDMGLFFAIDGVKPGSNTGGIDDYISLQIFDYRNYELLSIVNLVDMLHSGMETAIQSVEDFKAHHPDMDVDDSLIQSIDKFTRWVDPGNPGGGLSDISIGLLDYANPKKVTDKKGRTLYWSNLRLMAQRGVMLLYTDMDFSLEEYICQHNAPLLRCINIHKSLCDHIRSRLPFGREKVYPSEEQMAKDSNIRALNSLRK